MTSTCPTCGEYGTVDPGQLCPACERLGPDPPRLRRGAAGLEPEALYAYRRLGYLITPGNAHRFNDQQLLDWCRCQSEYIERQLDG